MFSSNFQLAMGLTSAARPEDTRIGHEINKIEAMNINLSKFFVLYTVQKFIVLKFFVVELIINKHIPFP